MKQSFLKEYPVKVIYNGIDVELFKPTQSNFRSKYNLENRFIILGVANIWDHRKGLNYFIELSDGLKKDEAIVIIGLSEKQKKKLPKSIIGIARTNNAKELVEIYNVADVFFNPTLEDNFPTTNLEAMACGTPVITFDTGGSVESIDENTGYIVNKGDLAHVRKILDEIKIEGKEQFKKKCIIRAAALFNKKDRFSDYIKLYESVYQKNRG